MRGSDNNTSASSDMRSFFFAIGHLSMAMTTTLLLLLPLLVDQASAFLGKQSSRTTTLPEVTASRFEVKTMLRMAAETYAEEEELGSSSTPAKTTSFPTPHPMDAAIAKAATAAAAPPSALAANTKLRLYQDEMGNLSTEPPQPNQDKRKDWEYFTPVCGCYDTDEMWTNMSTTTTPKKTPQAKMRKHLFQPGSGDSLPAGSPKKSPKEKMWKDFTQVFLNAGCDG